MGSEIRGVEDRASRYALLGMGGHFAPRERQLVGGLPLSSLRIWR